MTPGSYAQVRLREPQGERVCGEVLSIGGPGEQVVVPGVASGPALAIRRRVDVWVAEPEPGLTIRCNGSLLGRERDLKRDDVLTVGDAQVVVTEVSRTLLRLEVCHLAGNPTVTPAGALTAVSLLDGSDEDLEIQLPPTVDLEIRSGAHLRRRAGLIAAAIAGALAVAAVLMAMLRPVSVEVSPEQAWVRTPGTWVAIRSGQDLLLWPGRHVVTAELTGYRPARAEIRVPETRSVHLRLSKLPGRLRLDTGGIAAAVSVDGMAAGSAPGILDVPAGRHTITLRAARYLDYVTSLEIQGARVAQDLKVKLLSAWGTLKISCVSPGADVTVDGVDSGAAPVTVAASSGVHEIQIRARGRQTWQSSIVLKAGETLSVGPVALGEPDAHLTLTSEPAGAEVSVAGTHWGRTPAQIDLPAGVAHWVVLTLPGYAPWSRAVFADPGRKLSVSAQLEPVWVRVTVRGEPAGAQLLIDGVARGRTPQSLDVSAVDHRIEVREEGFLPFEGNLGAAAGLERTLEYHLIALSRVHALLERTPILTTQGGYKLRLVPPGSFEMGSPPGEPGRRANEALRDIALDRPFYLGVTEVTNGHFRQFRPEHSSGAISGRSIDHDSEPVTQVSWEDAAEYCNWLSEREGLPAAYDLKGGQHIVHRPFTVGFRLPTEAEWEYAARYAAPGKFYRYAWGDALPVPEQAGNFAGAETSHSLPASLSGYRDAYPVVAPVGQFKPTALGLYDIAGNVAEWVNDYYSPKLNPTPGSDPFGPEAGSQHAIRGSSWQSASPSELRLAWRDGADDRSPTIGFRIARYADMADLTEARSP
jgi:formylglycine-generating enzyme required for sulfatase activity